MLDVEFIEYDSTKYKRPGILAYRQDLVRVSKKHVWHIVSYQFSGTVNSHESCMSAIPHLATHRHTRGSSGSTLQKHLCNSYAWVCLEAFGQCCNAGQVPPNYKDLRCLVEGPKVYVGSYQKCATLKSRATYLMVMIRESLSKCVTRFWNSDHAIAWVMRKVHFHVIASLTYQFQSFLASR